MQPADSVEFNGTRYYRWDRHYRARKVFLHREVYAYHYGNIPHGWHIHHIDGDGYNNDISNLKAIPMREHLSMHAKGRKFDRPLKPYVCDRCGTAFEARSNRPARFCSGRCKTAWGRERART